LPAYRLPSPYERPPLRRRASGLALALAVNLLLLLMLLGLSRFGPVPRKPSQTLIVDLVAQAPASSSESPKPAPHQSTAASRPLPKPPPIVLPTKPTITPPPKQSQPWIEMSNDELAASDISNLPKGEPGEGDSEIVGRAPNGEVLYAAEWARRPTNAELGGYLPKNAPEGTGIIACKTIPGDRVDDCLEVANDPPGSHLASAVRQAAWQFRVRPPRVNGRPLIGKWVRILIDYESIGQSSGE
jgi:hypothetical protein